MARRLLLTTLMLATAALAAAPAHASLTQESSFQDDNLLLYNTPAGTAKTLDSIQALGADRLRLSIFWRSLAPDPNSKARPQFDAGDPAAYPSGSWDRYDRVIAGARARGMDVNFDLTGPAPLWATQVPPRKDIEPTFDPSAAEFGQFVHAVATRYSGSYVPPDAQAAPRRGTRQEQGVTPALPRVNFWSIWNEPNQGGWLTPQWATNPQQPKTPVETSPIIYRDLLDSAYAQLKATGHGDDTIIVGETAPKGLNVPGVTRSIKALHFIRQLYCLNDAYKPYQGTSAQIRHCPINPEQIKSFPGQHPGLFLATGWAHHPYELTFSPRMKPEDPDFATIANLPKLSGVLSRCLSAYGQARAGGMPLYLTEFGYQTRPPDPLGVTLRQQSAFLNESEFIAYANPNVRTLSQFLLVDDKPIAGQPRNSVAAWGSTFQSGLLNLSLTKKPAFTTYRFPIYLPHPTIRKRHRLRVWGLLRVAPNGTPEQVQVDYKAKGKKTWKTVTSVAADPARGYLEARVKIPRSGAIRLSWPLPGHSHTVHSRIVYARVR